VWCGVHGCDEMTGGGRWRVVRAIEMQMINT